MVTDTSNPVFQLAAQFVNQTACSVFLTGKAGTGKTTFLRHIREHSFKKMAVVAPTGVAAINAGGTTMHSFFQLPFGPFIPTPQFGWNPENPGYTDPNSLLKNIRLNAAKRELLQELELLVIDEISMVRADMLDAVDTILRHFRNQPLLPFGGVQTLYIGDLYQLPPVVQDKEWEILKPYYQSPFFFDAQVIRQAPPICLELSKIHRQNELRFINLLNKIRNNQVDYEDLELLHDYYQPEFMTPRGESYITLTSHNSKADGINQEELGKLKGETFNFEASVIGEFSDKTFPADKTLAIKEGAQIMLIKNDKGENRRYYNGKIGTVKGIQGDKIKIEFPDERDELVLEKEVWRNVRYNYDQEKDKIEEEEIGSFSQYPIRLAWAITIHKSQGLTFERAIIDAGSSFAPGQVYVALSRLTSLEGLVLRSRILPHSISTDPRVVAFTEKAMEPGAIEQQLEQEQLNFISESLLKTFQWSKLTSQLQSHHEAFAHRAMPDKVKALELSRKWLNSVVAQEETAQKFSRQLSQLLPAAEADGYQQLQQRTTAAVGYFSRILEEEILTPLQEHIGDVRVKQKVKKYLQDLQLLKVIFTRKKQQLDDALQMIEGLRKGVDTNRLFSELEQSRRSRETPIPESEAPTSSGKPAKGETNRISLGMFKEGVPIAEIASRRSLTTTTVESHLASFIASGEIDIKQLVPENKIKAILDVIQQIGGSALGPFKSRLGDDYSFGEIRAVLHYARTLPS